MMIRDLKAQAGRRRLGFVVEVKGLRPGAGWIPVIDTESDDPKRVRRDLIAQGMRYVVETREYRVVARND